MGRVYRIHCGVGRIFLVGKEVGFVRIRLVKAKELRLVHPQRLVAVGFGSRRA